MHKTVSFPIRVTQGDYCWNHRTGAICNYFDNEGGHPSCDIKMYPLERDEDGVRKPSMCVSLIEIK